MASFEYDVLKILRTESPVSGTRLLGILGWLMQDFSVETKGDCRCFCDHCLEYHGNAEWQFSGFYDGGRYVSLSGEVVIDG